MHRSVVLRVVLTLCVSCVMASAGCVLGHDARRADRSGDAMLTQSVFGIWVTRWDFQSQEDVRRIFADAEAMGVTDVFWQVRGQADAYYRSSIEPWGEELTLKRDDKNKPVRDRSRALDPGYDPLMLASHEAHQRGIRIHAWINVMPLWKGTQTPIDGRHPLQTRPHWRLSDETGKPQALSDGYVVINPVLDETQDYIVRVVKDIADRYDIDGVHLDYIRFLSDELDTGKLYPGDARSLSLYARMENDRATVGQLNRTKYRAWIRDRISTLVERIGEEALAGHDQIRYTAAVWRRPDLARDKYLQDAQRWVNEGVVDMIMPMIYTADDAQFESDLRAWHSVVDRRRVIPGIGAYKHSSGGQTLSQVTLGHPRRFVLFAYSSIFESANPDQDRRPEQVQSREHKRDALVQFIDRVGT